MSIRKFVFLLVPCMTLALIGCSSSETPEAAPEENAAAGDHAGHDHAEGEGHEHAHPSAGPHGGSLVELGQEEYHVELVHDDQAGTVTFYILDAHVESAVPLDAREVIVNLTHEGKGAQFKVAASPQSDDPPGKSSRFISADQALAEALDHEHASAQLVVTIAGHQYRGEIVHHHDHEAHEHEEEGLDHQGAGHDHG